MNSVYDEIKPGFEKRLLLITASVLFGFLLLNSINSINFFKPDEYYQIIEFAAFKQGKVQAADLAWEYQKKSRQAIQPFMCYLLFEGLDKIHVSEPIQQIRILRIATSLVTISCIFLFVASALKFFIPPYRSAFIISSFLFWAVPFFYVRFSSESFSQSLFLLAFSILFTGNKNFKRTFLLGMILGLTFFVRFQSAFGFIGLFVGLVLFHHFKFIDFVHLALGSAAVIFLCVAVDAWFYGTWIFTPWNYFYYNIMQKAADNFGIYPFYYYLVTLFLFSTPICGVIFFAVLGGLAFFRKINVIYLTFISSFLILSIIGHKEFRFLISILNFLPFLTILGIQEICRKKPGFIELFSNKVLLAVLISLNVIMLSLATLKNNNLISRDPKALAVAIVQNYSHAKIQLIYAPDCHPFRDVVRLKFLNDTWQTTYQHFLMPKKMSECCIFSLEDSCLQNKLEETTQILYLNKATFISMGGRQDFNKLSYQLKYISIPRWFDDILNRNAFLGAKLNKNVYYAFVRS